MRGRSLLLVVCCLCVGLVAAGPARAEYGSVGTFADLGSGPGQLGAWPGDAAVEQSTGNVFIVDKENNRIQVFSTSGDTATYLTEFGADILSQPFGIAVAEAGGQTSIYVSDAGNSRIVKYDSDEQPTPTFSLAPGFTSPSQGSGPEQLTNFSSPLAIAPNGDLWAADRTTGQIKAFSPTGTYVAGSNFDGSDSPQGAFGGVLDIAVDPATGDLIVDSSPLGDPEALQSMPSRVERFSASGDHLDLLSTYKGFEGAGSVAVDPATDNVLVISRIVGYKNPPAKIEVWSPAGELLEVGELPVFGGGFDPGPLVTGAAVLGSTGRLYLAARYGFSPSFSKGLVVRKLARPVVAVDPVPGGDIGSTTVEITGTVDPKGLQTNYHFEYRRKGDTAWTPLTEEDAGSGSGQVPVSATISGLLPGRAYQVRLLAVNSDRPAISSPKEFVTKAEQPLAETRTATEIGNVSARLRGTVDPRGGATTYYFELGTTTAYGRKAPQQAVSADPLGANQVSELVTGLQPSTTYHYRIVAVSSQGTTIGNDVTFNTAAAAPEFRGFEKVSPGGKNGYDVSVEFFAGVFLPESVRMSADGSLVGFQSSGGFAGAETTNISNEYSARRTANGWVTRAHAPRGYGSNESGGAVILGWADDGQTGVFAVGANGPLLTPNSTPGTPNLYRVDTATGALKEVTPDPGYPVEGLNPQMTYVGGSADLSTIFFEDTLPRAAGAPASPAQTLYEWRGENPKPAAILPDESLAPQAGIGDGAGNADNAVSDDGSRMYFTAAGELYMREDGTTTIPVSVSQKTSPDAAQPARFWTASADGRFVFFTTAEKMLDEDTDELNDLYRYDVETGDLIRVNAGSTSSEYAGVSSVIGASADGSYVYFIDILRESGRPFAIQAWHEGEVSFVADLEFDFERPGLREGTASRVSADGTGLVFLSSSAQPRPGMTRPGGTDQVYFYDADSDELSCASCREDGKPSLESALLPQGYSKAQRNVLVPAGKPRSISADGDRVFFTSADPLAPADGNGKRDAYEFHTGEARLLSTGQSPYASYFLDATSDGADVLIGTREKLTRADKDSNYDLYLTRLGGVAAEDAALPPCSGEGCQGPYPQPPAEPVISTGSAGSSAPGNSCDALKARAAAKRRAANEASPKRAKGLRKQARRLEKQFKRCSDGANS